jgi:hypothetical protein
MANKPDIKQQLETIVGEQLNEHTVDTIQILRVVASSSVSDGFFTRRSFIAPVPTQCPSAPFLDVFGLSQTGDDGTTSFRLSSFICPSNQKYLLPINVVATPLATAPRFLTIRRSLLNNGTDVEIQVSTWDANGTPAPNVVFDWRCRAQLGVTIL